MILRTSPRLWQSASRRAHPGGSTQPVRRPRRNNLRTVSRFSWYSLLAIVLPHSHGGTGFASFHVPDSLGPRSYLPCPDTRADPASSAGANNPCGARRCLVDWLEADVTQVDEHSNTSSRLALGSSLRAQGGRLHESFNIWSGCEARYKLEALGTLKFFWTTQVHPVVELDRYAILSVLGWGPRGAVYRARDQLTDSLVVL